MASFPLSASQVTLDFEGLADGASLTTQYHGLTFTNTTVITAGISLNEFEFPPHSGTNVVFDDGGPISIAFASPVQSFGGYFTYGEPLTIQAFDSSDVQVSSITSLFSNNEAISGDPGSSPNQFLEISSAFGIWTITIAGDPAGGSFVVDDLTFTSMSVPEPGSTFLLLTGIVGILAIRKRGFLMKRRIALSVALIAGLFVIGAEGYLLARPTPRVATLAAPMVRISPTPEPSTTGSAAGVMNNPVTTVSPTVGIPSTTPSLISVNTPTTVTVTVQISPSPIPGAVNLLRLGATGTQPTILGVMHDDGQNGDAVAGDGIYTIAPNFNETTGSDISLEVSAAFKGHLQRLFSKTISLHAWPVITALGVSMNYPPTTVIETQSNTSISIQTSPDFNPIGASQKDVAPITVEGFQLTINSYPAVRGSFAVMNWIKEIWPLWQPSKVQPTFINGTSGYYVPPGDGDDPSTIIIPTASAVYVIIYNTSYFSSEADAIGQSIIQTMLSTLHFL
jgi:hypothetical protein